MPTVPEIHRRGTRATQPAATVVTIGTLYFVTDELITERSDGAAWQTYSGAGAGGGDVDGPASATDLHIAVFDGVTGKLIKDGGATISEIVAGGGGGSGDVLGPASATVGRLAVFNNTSGKELADGGQTLAELQAAAVAAAVADVIPVNLASEVTGTLPLGSVPVHAATHVAGGGDAIPLDDLAAPTDVTDLNATTSAHGLLRKLSGIATEFLNGAGVWTTPPASAPAAHKTTHQAGGGDALPLDTLAAPTDVTTLNASTSAHGLLRKLSGVVTDVLKGDGTWGAVAATPRIGAVGLVIDGGGAVITPGVKGFLRVPFACTITGVTLLSTDPAVTAGSIVIDIWKDTYANYPPTVADTITASAKPTLSSAIKSEDATLTGWTTAIAAGEVLGFKVDSVTTLTRVALSLTVQAA